MYHHVVIIYNHIISYLKFSELFKVIKPNLENTIISMDLPWPCRWQIQVISQHYSILWTNMGTENDKKYYRCFVLKSLWCSISMWLFSKELLSNFVSHLGTQWPKTGRFRFWPAINFHNSTRLAKETKRKKPLGLEHVSQSLPKRSVSYIYITGS